MTRWAPSNGSPYRDPHSVSPPAAKPATTVDLSEPGVVHRRLTSVGADFFGWTDHGHAITWTLGSHIYRRPLGAVTLDPPGAGTAGDRPLAGKGGVESFDADIAVPRDTPRAVLVLRGATAITMRGDEVIEDADIVVRTTASSRSDRATRLPSPPAPRSATSQAASSCPA